MDVQTTAPVFQHTRTHTHAALIRGGLLSFNFVYFVLTVMTTSLAAWSFCLLCVMLAPSVVVATAACPTVMSLFTLFSGQCGVCKRCRVSCFCRVQS